MFHKFCKNLEGILVSNLFYNLYTIYILIYVYLKEGKVLNHTLTDEESNMKI